MAYRPDIKVNVSLTSFPARISIVPQVIRSIINQSVKPDRILLWLSRDQFPMEEADLPAELTTLKENGLEIMWCDDIRPHKKYFYTMQKYPHDITITVDDDVVYKENVIETLLKSYERFPFAVSCLRAHQITLSGDGNLNGYRLWKRGVPYFFDNFSICITYFFIHFFLLPKGRAFLLIYGFLYKKRSSSPLHPLTSSKYRSVPATAAGA